MIRAVLVEHIANQRHKTLGNPRLIRTLGGRQRFKPVLSEALVVQHANDIVVTRDEPRRPFVGEPYGRDRLLRTQSRVEWKWIGFELRAGDVNLL